jgi:hypothetical protein
MAGKIIVMTGTDTATIPEIKLMITFVLLYHGFDSVAFTAGDDFFNDLFK